jgi:CRISPR/Cas system-associated protein endoribonuclease Cas2
MLYNVLSMMMVIITLYHHCIHVRALVVRGTQFQHMRALFGKLSLNHMCQSYHH